MLKLLGQNSLSTKTGHNYWKYSKYSDAPNKYMEWIMESIKHSKNDHVRVRVNDFIKELGLNFNKNCYYWAFTTKRGKIPDFFFYTVYNDTYMQDPKFRNDLYRTLKLEDYTVLKPRSQFNGIS